MDLPLLAATPSASVEDFSSRKHPAYQDAKRCGGIPGVSVECSNDALSKYPVFVREVDAHWKRQRKYKD